MENSKRPRLEYPDIDGNEPGEGPSYETEVDVVNEEPDDPGIPNVLAGRIEALHMENFMCHTNLEITFDKRITFITGNNGSGKSTIMAALIVVLGGTANCTGRGSGINDFIKKGSAWARITITLNNEGINAYKRDIFGRRIIITRTLSKTASSSYICKSEYDEIVTKRKEDIEKIVTGLDLQIKNPICILNQDVARSFLSAADRNMRYSMFMKATHLENLKQIYTETCELLRASQKELDDKQKALSEARKEIRQLREKLEYFASLEKYLNEKTTLENEYLWSLVSSEEKSIENLINKRKDIEAKIQELADKETYHGDMVKKLEEDIKEYQGQSAYLAYRQSENRAKKKDVQAEIQNIQRQADNVNAHLKQLIMKSERQENEIKSIHEHLQQNEEMSTQNQAEKNKITDELKKLKNELKEIRDRIESTRRDNDNAMETKLQHTMTLENLKSDLSDLERSERILSVQAERASSTGENILLKFGHFTPKLKELIEEAAKRNQFQNKPVGPCGVYVTLSSDNKWAKAVESVTSGLMGTYCCDNQKDFQVLSRLMDKLSGGKNPPIIISKFQSSRHNVASEKVSVRGLSSVLEVLDFSNDVVFNTFIDQARLETILLFETDAQAASLLTHIQNVPKNLRMGLTVNCDQYYPAPNYRTYYGDGNRALKYFDTSIKSKAVKDKLYEEVKKAQMAIREKNKEISEMKIQIVKVTEFLKKTDNNLRLLKQSERQTEAKINELMNQEETAPVLPTRVVLEEELVTIQKSLEEVRGKIEQENRVLEEILRTKDKSVEKLDAVLQVENQISQEVLDLHQKLEESKDQVVEEKSNKEVSNARIEDIQVKLNAITTEINSRNKSLAHMLKTASEVHTERVETKRSPVELQKLLEKCEKYLQAAEKKLEPKDLVIREYKMKQKKFREMKATADLLHKVVDSLYQIAYGKKERFLVLQSHTANLVSFHFQACLQTRGYDGHLKFDFENHTLDIEVIPKDGLVRKDTKTLSGGERSYSTVSFILAIWRAVQMPFYFLDEFDVFMDKVNRKVIMDLLLEHAKNQTRMQFIFITPQDISNIQASDCVSIYKMPDPRQ